MNRLEGAMFYWIFWIFWVYVTFMMEKSNQYRLKLAAIILIVIILSNSHLFLGRFEITWSGILLLLFSYFFIANEKFTAIIYYSICALIISIAYVSFHLFEIFDPIWVILKKEWLISIGMCFLTIILQKKLHGRIVIAVSGTMQGEFLTAFVLNKLHIPYSVGGFAYLDVCSLTSVLLVCWSLLENLGAFLQNQLQLYEKAKQKSS
ncbi:hypothetical protein JK635_18315 [Neobacillus sp. YIM B02564]|uniref:Uncharacterized protein n=1 Tax=Neobacillus paridis TaxID=2803862 RepID=A0ABS1TSV1_9BACI|nr:hypothetical protein [Neobacillus paridis]MBL4954124.1 hypothetical protein [Neobacillus paridis]